MKRALMLGVLGLCLLAQHSGAAAAESLVLYGISGTDPRYLALTRDFLKERGYDVFVQLGELSLDKHLEKIFRVNRSNAKFMLAMEFAQAENTSVMVAMTDWKEKQPGASRERNAPFPSPGPVEGQRFMGMEELQGKHAALSAKLAQAVAASFQVNVKHVPLFPLLGADLPAIFLRVECKQEALGEVLRLLHTGVQNFLRRDTSNER